MQYLFFALILFCSNPISLDFGLLKQTYQNCESDVELKQQLAKYEGQLTSLRGFIHQANNGSCFLSQSPQLKCCCVGKSEKLDEQVLLLDQTFDAIASHQAVTVKGYFFIRPVRDDSDNLIQLFGLDQVEIDVSKKNFPYGSLIGVLILGVTCLLIVRKFLI